MDFATRLSALLSNPGPGPMAGGDWRDHLESQAALARLADQEKQRADKLAEIARRVRKETRGGGRRLGCQPAGCRQGSPKAIRDLDTIDPRTGEPRIYRTASAAAAALGVTRAHHVLRAAKRGGRAGGHRVQSDEDYQRRADGGKFPRLVQLEGRRTSALPLRLIPSRRALATG